VTVLSALREAAEAVPAVIKLVARLAADSRVDLRARLLVAGAVGYTLLPIDIVPDWVPVLGRLDDVVVAALAMKVLMEGAGEDVVREHWDGSDRALEAFREIVEWLSGAIPGRVRRLLTRRVQP
jgi:uncharacterized membrane protein YkvA (DUF1232 family)